jgi:predicted HTH transcriptional regulator
MTSLEDALVLGHEVDSVDFKHPFDPTSAAEWLELLKDIPAMANSGGGLLIVGLDDQGTPSGREVTPLFSIDPADIANKVYKYTGFQFHEFQLLEATKEEALAL